jgi:hypothetical protein
VGMQRYYTQAGVNLVTHLELRRLDIFCQNPLRFQI